MSTTVARLGVDITANDKTAAGTRSAERRVTGVVKNVRRGATTSEGQVDQVVRRTRVGLMRTFNELDGASRRLLGPGGGGLVSRLGAVGQASSAVGAGMGEAAASGGILVRALGAVGVAGAATAGVIGGVAWATDKLITGWAKGVAGAGQFARTIGVTTKALQEFQGAGERLGIDKETSGAGLAGLATTLNDAKNARNSDAYVLLRKLGVDFKTKADGSVDVMAMLPSIARGIQAQNAQGRLRAANMLGLGGGLVPLLAQGPQALAGDMGDVGRRGNVATDAQVEKATSWRRRRAIAGQMGERLATNAGELGYDASSGALDAVLSAGDGAAGAAQSVIAALPSAAHSIDQGARRFAGAVERFVRGVVSPGQSPVVSLFGPRRAPRKPDGTLGSAFHKGIDFRYADGTPVGAAAAGVVKAVRSGKGYGNLVDIDHGGGIVTRYAHLARAVVRIGQRVAGGQQIALSGHSGGVAPHMHFEEWKNGAPIDAYGVGGILHDRPQLAANLNNPGGVMGRDGRFKRYGSAMDGVREMASTLATYQDKHGINTIDGIVNRYAPKGHGKNDPELYAKDLSSWTGFGRGQQLQLHDPRTLAQLVAAMIRQESGKRLDPGQLQPSIMEIRFVGAPPGTKAKHTDARGRISHAEAGR